MFVTCIPSKAAQGELQGPQVGEALATSGLGADGTEAPTDTAPRPAKRPCYPTVHLCPSVR